MWVRGLKLCNTVNTCLEVKSHPMWVRGLKRTNRIKGHTCLNVAPYVGAWIETGMSGSVVKHLEVAPYVGAWIETEWYKQGGIGLMRRTLCGCVD